MVTKWINRQEIDSLLSGLTEQADAPGCWIGDDIIVDFEGGGKVSVCRGEAMETLLIEGLAKDPDMERFDIDSRLYQRKLDRMAANMHSQPEVSRQQLIKQSVQKSPPGCGGSYPWHWECPCGATDDDGGFRTKREALRHYRDHLDSECDGDYDFTV